MSMRFQKKLVARYLFLTVCALVPASTLLACSAKPGADEEREVDIVVRVQEELDRGQRFDGQKFDRLVALGPDAVPALGAHLQTKRYPKVILSVLGELGDARATPAIVDFMEQRRSGWSTQNTLSIDAVRALREIADPRAEPLLLKIISDESNQPKLRFYANTALARLGSPSVKTKAWNEIIRLYRTPEDESDRKRPYVGRVTDDDLHLGLVEVLTEEADEALASFLIIPDDGFTRRDVMSQLERREETRGREKIVEALLYVAEHEYKKGTGWDKLLTQARAFEVLLALKAAPPETLAAATGTWDEAIENMKIAPGRLAASEETMDDLRKLREDFFEKYPQHRKEAKAGATIERDPSEARAHTQEELRGYFDYMGSPSEYKTQKNLSQADVPVLRKMLADPVQNEQWWYVEEFLWYLGQDVTVTRAHTPQQIDRYLGRKWVLPLSYRNVQKYLSQADVPALIAMLDDKRQSAKWSKIVDLLGYIDKEEESADALIAFIQRSEDWERLLRPRPRRAMLDKANAIDMLGFIGGDTATDALRVLLTEEGSDLFLSNWIDDEIDGQAAPRDFIRGRAALGLVYTQEAANIQLVEEEYQSLLPQVRAINQRPGRGSYYTKCATKKERQQCSMWGQWVSALATRDYIESEGIEAWKLALSEAIYNHGSTPTSPWIYYQDLEE